LTTLKRGTKRKIGEVEEIESVPVSSKRRKINNDSLQSFENNVHNLAPQTLTTNSGYVVQNDVCMESEMHSHIPLSKNTSSISLSQMSLEGMEMGSNDTLSYPHPVTQYSSFLMLPRRITLSLNFPPLNTNSFSSPTSSMYSSNKCLSTKLSTCGHSSSISSYSSSQLLFSSVLLQRKSQGSIETVQDNFSSQSQSSRPYTTVESLKEYFGERREPQFSLSPSISGFHC
jgi:hypothetical protein